MQRRSSDARLSRRSLLGATGSAAIAATAGCLGSALSSSPGRQQIEPTEPDEDREGTPEEFYYFLEENGIEVESLEREGDDLFLVYDSDAEDLEESEEEIWTVVEVYRRALIQRGSEIDQLIVELTDSFDEQADGWGLDTEWIVRLDDEEMSLFELWNHIVQTMVGGERSAGLVELEDADEDSDADDTDDGDGDEDDGTEGDETDEAESDESAGDEAEEPSDDD